MGSSLRSERLAIRISPQLKEKLLLAAETRHKSLSEFILDTAITEAENVLAEKRQFELSPEAWDKFQKALDATTRKHPRMERLLNEPSVFG